MDIYFAFNLQRWVLYQYYLTNGSLQEVTVSNFFGETNQESL